MVLTPGFRQEEIERSRKQRLAAIQQELDDPETIADKRYERFLFGTHPYARSVEGTQKSIPALTRDEIVRFYDTHYAPNNSILAIVGDITPEIAVAAAKAAFGGWTRKPVPRTLYPPAPSIKGRHVLIVDKPDVNQSQIRIGTIGIRRSDPAYFQAQVMATILGGGFTSWLNQEIREKRGLSYGARCRLETRLEPGPLTVSTFTKNETVGETIKVALDTLSRFRDGKFTADDLRKAQNFRAGQYPLSVETTDQLAAQVADLVFYGLGRDFVDRQIEHIRSVTLEELRSVAPKLPVSDYMMVVVTNAAAVRPQLEGLGTIEVVKYDAPE
jgi:zinc protease